MFNNNIFKNPFASEKPPQYGPPIISGYELISTNSELNGWKTHNRLIDDNEGIFLKRGDYPLKPLGKYSEIKERAINYFNPGNLQPQNNIIEPPRGYATPMNYGMIETFVGRNIYLYVPDRSVYRPAQVGEQLYTPQQTVPNWEKINPYTGGKRRRKSKKLRVKR